jgi:hypothetical protein
MEAPGIEDVVPVGPIVLIYEQIAARPAYQPICVSTGDWLIESVML